MEQKPQWEDDHYMRPRPKAAVSENDRRLGIELGVCLAILWQREHPNETITLPKVMATAKLD